MRELLLLIGMVPNLATNSVIAVRMEFTEPTALVTRDEAIVENTLGTITTARMAMMASTPIISTRLKPWARPRKRRGDFLIGERLYGWEINRPNSARLEGFSDRRSSCKNVSVTLSRAKPTWIFG